MCCLSPIHTADATQLSSWVTSASAVWTQFASGSRRLPTDSVDNLETEHRDFTTWILIDIDNFFDIDVIVSSLVTNLNSSISQEIINWVTTADGCVHTAERNSTRQSRRRRRCVLGITSCQRLAVTWVPVLLSVYCPFSNLLLLRRDHK